MSAQEPAYRIRNIQTGIVLPNSKGKHGFLTFVTRAHAEKWIAAQKPDLPYEDFAIVEAGDE